MMTPEAIKKLTDQELEGDIALAQAELKARADKRKQDTIEEIRRLAASVQLRVNISGPGTRSARNGKPMLKGGERYQHPTDPTKTYTVGKGRPPEWFEKERAKGTLKALVS